MTPEILEWISKAEGDWATVLRESAVTTDPNFNAVCFHAQQCAEKYLKARLVVAGITFRKSHDLLYLLELVDQVEPSWKFLRDSLFKLTTYAVAIRYPWIRRHRATIPQICRTLSGRERDDPARFASSDRPIEASIPLAIKAFFISSARSADSF